MIKKFTWVWPSPFAQAARETEDPRAATARRQQVRDLERLRKKGEASRRAFREELRATLPHSAEVSEPRALPHYWRTEEITEERVHIGSKLRFKYSRGTRANMVREGVLVGWMPSKAGGPMMKCQEGPSEDSVRHYQVSLVSEFQVLSSGSAGRPASSGEGGGQQIREGRNRSGSAERSPPATRSDRCFAFLTSDRNPDTRRAGVGAAGAATGSGAAAAASGRELPPNHRRCNF